MKLTITENKIRQIIRHCKHRKFEKNLDCFGCYYMYVCDRLDMPPNELTEQQIKEIGKDDHKELTDDN